MPGQPCDACPPDREVNPLLFAVFCPGCLLSGLSAAATAGIVTLPSILGVSPEAWLAPIALIGGFGGWIAWGWWAKRQARRSSAPVAGAQAGT